MKHMLAYVKSKGTVLCFMMIAVAVFTGAFALFHLPVEAVLYPAVIVAFIGLAFLIADYLRTRTKCRELERMASMTAEMIGTLPETDTLPEAAWSHLAAGIREELIRVKADARNDYQDMVDYYTVWAHQIKTPIAAMKLTLQSEDTELSRQLRSDLFRTQQYVDMVLAFLRLGADSTDYVFRSACLDEIIRPSVRKFAPEFIRRRLSLHYETISTTLITDEKWLAFVLEQLLSNALKYTREGSITIRMADERTLCIEDTGIGIAPDDLPRVFDKGYTGYNGRMDKNASGLGLYLCRCVCNRLNMGIRIASQVGQGTQIFLTLPE